jgi:hypothetical protein
VASAALPAAAQDSRRAGLPGTTPENPPRPGTPAAARAWLAATLILTLAAAAAAVALAPSASAPAPEGLAFLLFVGSSVHVAATGWFYTVPAVREHARRHQARFIWVPVALIAAASAAAMLVRPALIEWCLLPYFCWQFFHYQKQNLGIAALAAAAQRVQPLRRAERRALLAAGVGGIAGLVAHPRLLQLPVQPGLAWLYPAGLGVFVLAAGAGVALLARRPAADRPGWFCLAYLSGLLFMLPGFTFASPYAAVGGLTVAHGLQYLLLVGLVAGGAKGGMRRWTQLAALVNIALIGGALLSVASDQRHGSPLARVLFGVFLGMVMAHFVVDAGLWRLRDQFPRSFLSGRLPYLLPGQP